MDKEKRQKMLAEVELDLSIFQNQLKSKEVDFKMAENNLKMLGHEILIFLLKNQLLFENYEIKVSEGKLEFWADSGGVPVSFIGLLERIKLGLT